MCIKIYNYKFLSTNYIDLNHTVKISLSSCIDVSSTKVYHLKTCTVYLTHSTCITVFLKVHDVSHHTSWSL